MGEWVAGRLDVSPETARDLATTTHRLAELPDLEDAIETGEIGFDRAVAIGRFNDRYVIVEPNLDESAWRLNGRLPGTAGSVVVAALDAKADGFPAEPDTGSRAVRNADVL